MEKKANDKKEVKKTPKTTKKTEEKKVEVKQEVKEEKKINKQTVTGLVIAAIIIVSILLIVYIVIVKYNLKIVGTYKADVLGTEYGLEVRRDNTATMTLPDGGRRELTWSRGEFDSEGAKASYTFKDEKITMTFMNLRLVFEKVVD